jgi:hypothetical protein
MLSRYTHGVAGEKHENHKLIFLVSSLRSEPRIFRIRSKDATGPNTAFSRALIGPDAALVFNLGHAKISYIETQEPLEP